MTLSLWSRMRSLFLLEKRVSFSCGNRRSVPGSPLTFITFTAYLDDLSSKLSPTIVSLMETTFPFDHLPPLASNRNEFWICFPASRTPCLSPEEVWSSCGDSEQVSADVFGLTSFLECLLRQLLDLDCCSRSCQSSVA